MTGVRGCTRQSHTLPVITPAIRMDGQVRRRAWTESFTAPDGRLIMTAKVSTTLTTFTDAANAQGLDKLRRVAEQRRLLEDATRRAGSFYGPYTTAIRRGVLAADLGGALQGAIDRASDIQRPNFLALRPGTLEVFARQRVTRCIPVPRGVWLHGDLEVRVAGLLGVELANGEQQAWVLHLKAEALTPRAADIPLYLASTVLAAKDAQLHVRVVDLRRAKVYKIHRPHQLRQLQRVAETEAASYVAYWQSAA